jgi:hypothetical protein
MRRSGTCHTSLAICVGSLLALLLAAVTNGVAGPHDEDLGALRQQFQQQTDPVKRAKLFSRLGAALLAEMKKLEAAKDYEHVTPLFLEYRDAASAAFNGLAAANHDAEKHPNGYRELEMHLRQSLHQLNDVVFAMPLEEREALLGPQHEIENIDNRLVKALFPRGPQAHGIPPYTANWQPRG